MTNKHERTVFYGPNAPRDAVEGDVWVQDDGLYHPHVAPSAQRFVEMYDIARDSAAVYLNALCDMLDAYDDVRAATGDTLPEPAMVTEARTLVTPLMREVRREQRRAR